LRVAPADLIAVAFLLVLGCFVFCRCRLPTAGFATQQKKRTIIFFYHKVHLRSEKNGQNTATASAMCLRLEQLALHVQRRITVYPAGSQCRTREEAWTPWSPRYRCGRLSAWLPSSAAPTPVFDLAGHGFRRISAM
jgi:hypothetical protein